MQNIHIVTEYEASNINELCESDLCDRSCSLEDIGVDNLDELQNAIGNICEMKQMSIFINLVIGYVNHYQAQSEVRYILNFFLFLSNINICGVFSVFVIKCSFICSYLQSKYA